MEKEDLIYICTTIGNLAGIPVRIYEDRKPVFYHCVIDLPADPIRLYEPAILALSDHVSYYATPGFDYYGVVGSGPVQIVLGPTRQTENSDRELERMAFELSIPSDQSLRFVRAMKNLIRFPLDSLLQMLCTINFMLNHERLSLTDINIYGITPVSFPSAPSVEEDLPEWAGADQEGYTSFDIEQRLMDIVTKGDLPALTAWIGSAPAIRPGLLSDDQLRQVKNLFVVTATLTSRAAIRGGLDTRTAFWLSDSYIRRSELLKDPSQISALQHELVLEYTRRVSRIRLGDKPTDLSTAAANYIQNHITEVITVDDLAEALYMSRSSLCARLRKDTGMSVVQMIQHIKTEEAKRLLLYSDRPISAISDYLGFSSQSHLTRVFEKITGQTPAAYRSSARAVKS
ncbi:MAG: helix-turn-helix domain-containing protein [Firmicutes bacterium]|nr:helix-turn-helix domain-containing protein [Bacillota bacterium]